VDALPAAPETVALYLSELASAFKVSTIQRRLAAIAEAHRTKAYRHRGAMLACRGCSRDSPDAPGRSEARPFRSYPRPCAASPRCSR